MQDFESFIIECCAADEWDLRDMLREKLSNAGFLIQEDDYRSSRRGRYQEIHNMLAIRGNPRVCLVAHTDVVRDHGFRGEHKRTDPVIKEVETFKGEKIRIIQDRNCKVQVGGDDRLGVAIGTYIALNSQDDLAMLFTTDEEICTISADYVSFPELKEFELLVQIDRGNQNSDQIVNNISGVQLCDKRTENLLLEIAEKINKPRVLVNGLLTDVLEIKRNNRCKNAVNLTCGYYRSHGPEEYIIIKKAVETKQYVEAIITNFAVAENNNENKNLW